MINAIAKRRLAFRKGHGSFITVVPGEFVSLPDECAKDPMFKWAVKDGVLVVSDQVIMKAAELPKEETSVEVEEKPKKSKKVTKK